MEKDVKTTKKTGSVAISQKEFELFLALKKNFGERLANVIPQSGQPTASHEPSGNGPADEVTISRQEYNSLREKCSELEQQVQWLMEQIGLHHHTVFGPSSEKSIYNFGQLHLFNEAECFYEMPAEAAEEEPAETVVQEHTRRTRAITDKMPENLPEEVVHCELPPDQRVCPDCGCDMHEIGTEIIRQVLKIIPARVIRVTYVQHNYGCYGCEQTSDHSTIVKAPVEAPVISGGFASPESVAHIMTQKMVMGTPLYRQEQELNRMGIPLSRQTMSNWFMRCARDWLRPIYGLLHKKLLSHEVLFADETTFQVLKEPGKSPQSKSYLWVFRTSSREKHPIVLSEYQPGRAAEYAKNFLGDFKGYLHCDGYAAYQNLSSSIIPTACWAHARRGYDKALKVLNAKDREGSNALRGKQFCDQLFKLERELADVGATPDERYRVRQEKAVPILKEYKKWLDSFGELGQSTFAKAVNYSLNQWQYLNNYLLDGRLELSNSLAERTVKPFVISRKNFLFANTPSGAEASAIVFSIVQTAIENGLDPYRYLVYIFQNAPQCGTVEEVTQHPEKLAHLLPEAVPSHIKAPLAKKPPRKKKKKR